MSAEVESWRAAQDKANVALEKVLEDLGLAQDYLRRAGEALRMQKIQVEAKRAEIEFYQERIDQIEAEDQANRPGSDEPTNIPAPDPEVPWTPIEPAEGEE